ncbi:hypothetical protein GCM10027258_92330 [Amycolatopsis stemonae]
MLGPAAPGWGRGEGVSTAWGWVETPFPPAPPTRPNGSGAHVRVHRLPDLAVSPDSARFARLPGFPFTAFADLLRRDCP